MNKEGLLQRIEEISAPDLGGFGEKGGGGASVRKLEGQLLFKICAAIDAKKIIETGTHAGCSTNYLLEWASKINAHVYTYDVQENAGKYIDTNKKSFLTQFKPQHYMCAIIIKLW